MSSEARRRDAESLRFAATLMCPSCRAFSGKPSEYVVPTEPPHRVANSSYPFWHRGIDAGFQREWPCDASPIWEYLETAPVGRFSCCGRELPPSRCSICDNDE